MKGKFIVSAFCGIFFAIVTFYVLEYIKFENALLISIFAGLMFYLMLLIFLLLYENILNKRYYEAEKNIKSNIWFKFNGNINTANSVRNANIYFTDDGIVFISLDTKPYVIEEVLIQNIEKIQSDYINKLNIYTNDNRLFIITSSEVKELFPILNEHNWMNKV
ncbi:MAG TPA: hypothetical protein GXX17_04455 [Clostridiales bacterium]|nr:hypothetical protein [Clostridiales bacterium]